MVEQRQEKKQDEEITDKEFAYEEEEETKIAFGGLKANATLFDHDINQSQDV